MTVVEVTKEDHMTFAGRPWPEVLTAVRKGVGRERVIHYGSMDKLREGEPEPTVGRPLLAFGSVWLREVDGRAFLYLTNY